jgi:hypothetical protein
MKSKTVISLAIVGVALAVVAILPAKTYLPSPDELSLVVGGADWIEGKSCQENLRCTGVAHNCSDIGCKRKEEGDACGSYNYFYNRDGCSTDPNHKCKYDDCSPEIMCTTHADCTCQTVAGESELQCKIDEDATTSSKVYPCTDMEMN